jgi:hypothetical protein
MAVVDLLFILYTLNIIPFAGSLQANQQTPGVCAAEIQESDISPEYPLFL